MAGGAAALVSFTAGACRCAHGIWQTVSDVLVIGIAALPVGMGVAILKYRLYEIDRIISRTLAYAIVTGLLVGVYAGLVLLATQVFPVALAGGGGRLHAGRGGPVQPGAAAGAAGVDRRFNRARYDGDQTVAAFAARLKDAVDLEAVRADLASVVTKALEPAHVSVWIESKPVRPLELTACHRKIAQHRSQMVILNWLCPQGVRCRRPVQATQLRPAGLRSGDALGMPAESAAASLLAVNGASRFFQRWPAATIDRGTSVPSPPGKQVPDEGCMGRLAEEVLPIRSAYSARLD